MALALVPPRSGSSLSTSGSSGSRQLNPIHKKRGHKVKKLNFKSNQNWLLHIQEPFLLKERRPENSKLHSYWNHFNVSTLWHREINLGSFIPLQITKFKKFRVPEYFLYQRTWFQREILLFSLQSFLSQRNHTWWSSFSNQQRKKLPISSQHVSLWSKLC